MSFQNIADLEDALRSSCLTVRDLYGVWEQRLPVLDPATIKKNGAVPDAAGGKQIDWIRNDLHLVSRFTRCALEKEEFLLVCDCAREALRLWDRVEDNDRLELVRVRMNYALALARLGYTRRARLELEPCVDDDFRLRLPRRLKTEILLQLGNILRQESRYASAFAAQVQTAGQALEYYARALEVDPDNLEALSLSSAVSFTTGEPGSALRERASEQAKRVLQKVHAVEDDDGPRLHTTDMRAVAQAVLGDTATAAASYAELAALPGANAASLANARYWSQFFAEGLGEGRDFFRSAFPPLSLVVFSGHLPDRPGETPRFPKYAVPAVRETIEGALAAHHVLVGMCSAAAGAGPALSRCIATAGRNGPRRPAVVADGIPPHEHPALRIRRR